MGGVRDWDSGFMFATKLGLGGVDVGVMFSYFEIFLIWHKMELEQKNKREELEARKR